MPAIGRGFRGIAIATLVAVGVLSPIGIPTIGADDRQTAAATIRAVVSDGEILCRTLGREVVVRTWRGIAGARSGDILMIPEEPNFVNGGLTHATPFDYTQEVPLFLYGPGYVRPGIYRTPVTLADLAPTLGALLGFAFDTRDGNVLSEALVPASERPIPALVLTLIWDSVGDNVLERWPAAWPVLRSLRTRGAWFSDATVGASPSNTPVAHATIGTGTFPRRHGLVDVYLRIGGQIQEPNEFGPSPLRAPTLADLYDLDTGNEAVVGAIATLSDHLMMMSHGAEWPGGDLDIAITREVARGPTTGIEAAAWNLTEAMAPHYRLPAYVNDLPPIETYVGELDGADGALDGRWRENDIAQLGGGFDTPARAPFQQALVETVIEREGFGTDEVPDLLFVNFKTADKIGHLFSADGIEMADTLAGQDAVLERLVDHLDATVGPGRWVLALAADHGTQHDPERTGAKMISADKLRARIAATFDDDDDDFPVVQKLRPSQIWLDRGELAENGYSVEQVASWMRGLTHRQTFAGPPPVPGEGAERVFAAVEAVEAFSSLPCLPRRGSQG